MPLGKVKKLDPQPLLLLSQQDRDKEQDARYYARLVNIQGETPQEAKRLLESLQRSRAARRKGVQVG